MEKRIELELRGRKPAEVGELNLDNCRATTIAGLTDEFTSLEALSMNNVGLTSLEGFPSLPALKRMELSENQISGKLDCLKLCPALTHLDLTWNAIKDVKELEPLNELKDLQFLDLYKCDLANAENYREEVFKVLPNIKYLDGYDASGMEPETDYDDTIGEGDEESEGDDEDDADEDVDEEGSEVGLEYLQSSAALHDEDETEDFTPDEDETDETRGTKRKHEEEEEEE